MSNKTINRVQTIAAISSGKANMTEKRFRTQPIQLAQTNDQATDQAAPAASDANTLQTEARDSAFGPRGDRASNGSCEQIKTFDQALSESGRNKDELCPPGDPVAARILRDYGAMFVASNDVVPPPVCIFENSDKVTEFQNKAKFDSAEIGDKTITLQVAALSALQEARKEAQKQGLEITPRGDDASRRDYDQTVKLWKSRVDPALKHWRNQGRLSRQEAEAVANLPISDQVKAVLELEKQGMYFNTDFSKSILYSVAAPGTSQHLSGLALDVSQHDNERVRQILAKHGWYQTVKSDLPHFTYLGIEESELRSHGLRQVKNGDRRFWIPNLEE